MKIQEIGVVSTGNTPSKNRREFWNSYDVGFVKPDLLSDDEITYIHSTNEYISNQAKEKSRIANKGSIFITCIGSIGKIGIAQKELAFNQQINVITPYSNINSKYLAYALLANKKRLQEIANAPVVPIINKTQFNNFEIDITLNNDSQLIITGILDKLRDIISKKKEQISMLDNLVKSRFIELFMGKGYPTKTVDEVSMGKGEYGAQSASIGYNPTRPRYVRITDINDDGTLNDDVVASINPSDDEQYKLEYGDFMFARMGATVGKTYAFIEGNQIFAGYLIRYRLNPELINPRYLYWYTRLDEYWNWVKLNQSGAAQPGINAKKYGSLQIPLPPIEEQNAFAAFVEQTDKSKLAIQKSLEETQKLFDSLMQEYFG